MQRGPEWAGWPWGEQILFFTCSVPSCAPGCMGTSAITGVCWPRRQVCGASYCALLPADRVFCPTKKQGAWVCAFWVSPCSEITLGRAVQSICVFLPPGHPAPQPKEQSTALLLPVSTGILMELPGTGSPLSVPVTLMSPPPRCEAVGPGGLM